MLRNNASIQLHLSTEDVVIFRLGRTVFIVLAILILYLLHLMKTAANHVADFCDVGIRLTCGWTHTVQLSRLGSALHDVRSWRHMPWTRSHEATIKCRKLDATPLKRVSDRR